MRKPLCIIPRLLAAHCFELSGLTFCRRSRRDLLLVHAGGTTPAMPCNNISRSCCAFIAAISFFAPGEQPGVEMFRTEIVLGTEVLEITSDTLNKQGYRADVLLYVRSLDLLYVEDEILLYDS